MNSIKLILLDGNANIEFTHTMPIEETLLPLSEDKAKDIKVIKVLSYLITEDSRSISYAVLDILTTLLGNPEGLFEDYTLYTLYLSINYQGLRYSLEVDIECLNPVIKLETLKGYQFAYFENKEGKLSENCGRLPEPNDWYESELRPNTLVALNYLAQSVTGEIQTYYKFSTAILRYIRAFFIIYCQLENDPVLKPVYGDVSLDRQLK